MSIHSLDNNLLAYTFERTDDIHVLGKCREVCKKFKDIIDATDSIWKNVCAHTSPFADLSYSKITNWKKFSIERYLLTKNINSKNFNKLSLPIVALGSNNNFAVFSDRVYQFVEMHRNITSFDLKTGNSLQKIAGIPLPTFKKSLPNLASIPFPSNLKNMCSLDDQYFAIDLCGVGREAKQISIWRAIDGVCVFAKFIPNYAFYHMDSSCVIYTTPGGKMKIRDYKTNTLLKQPFKVPISQTPLYYSKLIGDLFFSIDIYGILHVIDIDKGAILYTIEWGHQFLSTNKFLVLTEYDPFDTQIHDINNGKLLHSMEMNCLPAYCEIANLLIGTPGGKPNTLVAWDLATGLIDTNLLTTKGTILKVYAKQNTAFISTSDPDELIILNILTGKILGKWENCKNSKCLFQDDICYFATSDGVHLWDLTLSKWVGNIQSKFANFDSTYHDKMYFDGKRLFHRSAPNQSLTMYDFSILPAKPPNKK